ncbi:MAG: DUF2271 domain-containing protein [Tannerellaceae bacterium]|nr:DUF2271 domain-containing protein [Tannerellaceae bacterium]
MNIRVKLIFFTIYIASILCVSRFSGYTSDASITQHNRSFGKVEITFRLERKTMEASNQFAVWIQNQHGEVVKTLFVTRYTAEGGYEIQPDCLPRWVDRANARTIPQEEVDGFSGATPQSGWHTYTWDGTDRKGNQVPAGYYNFIVEASYNRKSSVLFMGLILTRGQEMTVEAQPGFYPEDYSVFGSNMIERVSATYIP